MTQNKGRIGILPQMGGNRVIRNLRISNFRCFESAFLEDCRTINVIVGPNASGKTALLESIFFVLVVRI